MFKVTLEIFVSSEPNSFQNSTIYVLLVLLSQWKSTDNVLRYSSVLIFRNSHELRVITVTFSILGYYYHGSHTHLVILAFNSHVLQDKRLLITSDMFGLSKTRFRIGELMKKS